MQPITQWPFPSENSMLRRGHKIVGGHLKFLTYCFLGIEHFAMVWPE